MKIFLPIALTVATLSTSLAVPQNSSDSAGLDAVLKKMDSAAASFRSTQADFEWNQYQKVVDETDVQKGTVYYRRSGKEIDMMAHVKEPDQKFVLYKDGKLQVYQPKIEQVIVHDMGTNRTEMESYLVLGFGGSGQDLFKAFDVTYGGDETIDGVSTGKLVLAPKSDKVKNTFTQIILWIDLARGISVQQKFVTPQGDFRLAKYMRIRINDKMPNDVFQLKTSGKTQTITH
ncbi:MAG TPA: outer membrane lipoprotein carrier protein LolA [Candidatus Sulfotelmatobacter sp.]